MDFEFKKVEDKWRKQWTDSGVYKVTEDPTRPKYYVLDMFPYPSGAGLHVGHPLGYVASDIYARYKRLKGFNVLHPMGFDAFGLPAEQYAIETGTPPQVTTDKAIATYKEQLGKIGFSFDWSREVKTCDPSYYKWTQWIFLQLFDSWYNRANDKAENISTLIDRFAKEGTDHFAQYDKEDHDAFTAQQWAAFSEGEKQSILMNYRLAYQSYSEVNWCEALGTVLANDEVKDGKSERGGYPVERRKMRQWFLRITEYSDRLLRGLDTIDWSDAMKDMQRNWIGRSEGALVEFEIADNTVLNPDPSPKEKGGDSDGPARFMTGDAEVSAQNLQFAKENRRVPTKAENKLWDGLRNEQLGFKFRRQHLIDKYIVDFVCLAKGLVVEADGAIHELTKEQDELRTTILEEQGFTVVRFTNDEILKDLKTVLSKIKTKATELGERIASPLLRRGAGGEDSKAVSTLTVFTTRPDTIYGATFMVIAPEHELVSSLTTPDQQKEVTDYIAYVKSRSDIERQQEKKVTGAFTGSYAINPFTNKPIPVYLAEYVLAGYGTGAIMAVPADDERDKKFAEKFGLPVIEVIDKSMYPGADVGDKVGKMINSDFLNGMEVKDAIKAILDKIETEGLGKRKVNYRQRDAGYSRQRYWGEPFPIVYKGDVVYPLPVSELPVTLPSVTSYKPSGDGRSPLASSTDWINHPLGTRETDTMPGYAASSWYFLRYMDPNNDLAFASKEKIDYWQSVDLYIGGTEHAVGHLLYSRMWHKFLYDLGYVPTDEPFKKLVNQGMIQGVSKFAYRLNLYNDGILTTIKPVFLSSGIQKSLDNKNVSAFIKIANVLNDTIGTSISEVDIHYGMSATPIHVDIRFAGNEVLDIDKFRNWRSEYSDAIFVFEEDGTFICDSAVEKMSKSKYNVVNPDDVIEKYGADCFRMFEMFLGPLEQSKPWDDKGIDGVGKFIRRFWRLFYDDKGNWRVTGAPAVPPLSLGEGPGVRTVLDAATDAENKVLHKTLKKISEDIERLQFNTCISQFMICLNELNDLKCTKRAILEPLLIALAPFAPFLTEELWQALGNSGSIHQAIFPTVEEKYLVESAFTYPISINGKVRANIPFALDMAEADIKAAVVADETVQKWLNGTEPKKFIFVKGRIINVVM
ncbi:MAG: leucine--tRNA ligase [Bacteroidetes bacterium]|nr:leucine--tRNA ligase [Bacteroidota bacterium]